MKLATHVGLPVKRNLALAYRLSLAVAVLMAVASAAGIALGLGGLYEPDPTLALGVTEAEAGLLLPGLLGQDIFSLVVGLPILLGSMWLARRGSLFALLLWPGALFYALYWSLIYVLGSPFSVLFLLYVPLVTLGAYATIAVVSSIDGVAVRSRLAGAVPARIVGGILVVLALLTLGQDATGAFVTALSENAPVDPAARPVWISDLALEVPAMLAGGVLLWIRRPLGYVAGAGLLLQYGLTPIGLVASMTLASLLAGTPLDFATSAVLLLFSVACFATLAFFIRGAVGHRPPARGMVTTGTPGRDDGARGGRDVSGSVTDERTRTTHRAKQRTGDGGGR